MYIGTQMAQQGRHLFLELLVITGVVNLVPSSELQLGSQPVTLKKVIVTAWRASA